jgi:hypothetical protein
MKNELKVISDFYDFVLWMIRHVEKFPRHHRYALGAAVETRLYKILDLLLRAKFTRGARELLDEVNIEIEILRFQIRLAKDLKIFPLKSHGYATEILVSIGSQVGGWVRSSAT